MLSIYCRKTLVNAGCRIGPVPYFRVEGERRLAGPAEEDVARHEKGYWHCRGGSYTTLELENPAWVAFHNEGQLCAGPFGPYEKLRFADGVL